MTPPIELQWLNVYLYIFVVVNKTFKLPFNCIDVGHIFKHCLLFNLKLVYFLIPYVWINNTLINELHFKKIIKWLNMNQLVELKI